VQSGDDTLRAHRQYSDGSTNVPHPTHVLTRRRVRFSQENLQAEDVRSLSVASVEVAKDPHTNAE
jgi:hypothetical protein